MWSVSDFPGFFLTRGSVLNDFKYVESKFEVHNWMYNKGNVTTQWKDSMNRKVGSLATAIKNIKYLYNKYIYVCMSVY